MRRVLVLGLDGLEPSLVETMMARGDLPNLAALRASGGYTRVATTTPAQTPVAWSSFATGKNPGGHGVFDFLRRDPQTYLPDLALARYERKNVFSAPRAVNLRGGTPIWSRLAEAGISATVLRCPCTFPPDPVNGRLLSGMGVPDLRGGFGTATFHTAMTGIVAGEGERVVPMEHRAPGRWRSHFIGPRDSRSNVDLRLEFHLETDSESDRLVFVCDQAEPTRLALEQDHWSAWIRIGFRQGVLRTVRGQVRIRLLGMNPHPSLYVSPVNFDPVAPLFPISYPGDYAEELARDIGPYYTTGMVEDHAGLSNARFDEDAYLEQCELVWEERERMMFHELERFQEGFFFCLFDTPDRVQHMFWRHCESDHPSHRGRRRSERLAHVIDEQYRRADDVVGRMRDYVDDETLAIALSDHGFGSFRRCVDLNTWLHREGLLVLQDGRVPGPEAGDLLRGVDWSRTKAYAIGLGGIYVNQRGREASGIVPPEEVEALKTEVARALSGLVDPDNGEVAVRSVRPREAVYSGPYVDHAPDLLVHTSRGYRVSWSTALGGIARSIVEDNTNAWSGDHIVDPALVPGVLFINREFRNDGHARLIDLAPTILEALGVSPGTEMEGESLQ